MDMPCEHALSLTRHLQSKPEEISLIMVIRLLMELPEALS